MPVAYLPSPVRSVWHLGPVPIRAYAICAVLGVAAALWLADWRYRRRGGRPGEILDIATVAVPVGLLGARIYSVVTEPHLYFGPGRDWVGMLRIWEGGLGIAGAVAAGAIAAWVYCRRAGLDLAQVAGAAAPALAVAQAIAAWGNWFSQKLYGAPSTLPWAVAIAPVHRVAGYVSDATFQPIFLYESIWDLIMAAAVIFAMRRFALTGDRAFALYAGLYAVGRWCAESLRIDNSPRLFGFATNQVAMAVVLALATGYLYGTRARRPAPPPRLPVSAAARRQLTLAGPTADADIASLDSIDETDQRPDSGQPAAGPG